MSAIGETRSKTWQSELHDAAHQGSVDTVKELLAQVDRKCDQKILQNGLRQALQVASSRGHEAVVCLLLAEGAPTDAVGKESPALIRAIEIDSYSLSKRLIYCDGFLPSLRSHPTTVGASKATLEILQRGLFVAVGKGNYGIVKELLDVGVDINVRDKGGRTALIHLAALGQYARKDVLKVEQSNYKDLIRLLFQYGINIEAKDDVPRTALHWAVALGNKELADILLSGLYGPAANVNALAKSSKTPLHLAAAKNSVDIVELLLRYGADCAATSNGAWTPLHNAAEKGYTEVVRMLLANGAEATAETENRRTALHWAAENGHVDCVRELMPQSGFKRHTKDSKGCSPLMLAGKSQHYAVMQLLSLFNSDESLSPSAKEICQEFNAVITDVNPQKIDTKRYLVSERRSIYDLLYATNSKSGKPAHTIKAKQERRTKRGFRWIHLPANNISWVEALLTKYYIERGADEVDAFQETDKSLSLQHRGQTVHSYYMKPSCKRISSMSRGDEVDSGLRSSASRSLLGSQLIDQWIDLETPRTGESAVQKEVRRNLKPILRLAALETQSREERSIKFPLQVDFAKQESPTNTLTQDASDKSRLKGETLNASARLVNGAETGRPRRRRGSKVSDTSFNESIKSVEARISSKPGEIFLFMPYLHFESFDNSRTMSRISEEVFRRKKLKNASVKPKLNDSEADLFNELVNNAPLEKRPAMERAYYLANRADTLTESTSEISGISPRPASKDEKLINAYLGELAPLHAPRTLENFYFPAGNTTGRDRDQVSYRYCRKYNHEPKVLMVDQLWLWILDQDLIVTSFPRRWEQTPGDTFNILNKLFGDLRDYHLSSVYELASAITSQCSGMFYTNRDHEEYRFLEMFEHSIGDLQDEEPDLTREFKEAATQAEEWFSNESKVSRKPKFDDYFTKVGKEMTLLTDAKDIQDELEMISSVLEKQASLLPQLQEAINSEFELLKANDPGAELRTTFSGQLSEINGFIADLDRMSADAGKFHDTCTQLLDLKQKYAGVFEARYSRMQAASSARQGQTIMVFTVVTVAFLPMSFIAAFFAIPIDELKQALPLSLVTRYIFGIGLAISVPLVVLALTVDNINRWYYKLTTKTHGAKDKDANGKSQAINTSFDSYTETTHTPTENGFLDKNGDQQRQPLRRRTRESYRRATSTSRNTKGQEIKNRIRSWGRTGKGSHDVEKGAW